MKALNIQRKAQPSVTPSNAAVFKQALPYDVFLQIFSYFEPNELLNFFTVSKVLFQIHFIYSLKLRPGTKFFMTEDYGDYSIYENGQKIQSKETSIVKENLR